MRIITTANKDGFKQYGHAWLDSRKHWPAGTEFYWYTESYDLPYQPDELQMIEQAGAGNTDGFIERRDCNDIEDFVAWKMTHAGYVSPSWKYNVVAYAHKVFAFADATKDYKGIAVWVDADCVTYRDIPKGLIEAQVKDAYLARYERPGRWTETGLFIVDCSHPEHVAFWQWMREVYLEDRYKPLHHWTDCYVMDAAVRIFGERITTKNLSGEQSDHAHPMAVTELGKYIDHKKGPRKAMHASPENRQREIYEKTGKVAA